MAGRAYRPQPQDSAIGDIQRCAEEFHPISRAVGGVVERLGRGCSV